MSESRQFIATNFNAIDITFLVKSKCNLCKVVSHNKRSYGIVYLICSPDSGMEFLR